MNSLLVPQFAVLFLQQEQPAGAILTRGHTRCVEMHQCQQSERFWSLARRMFRQNGSQPYRFVAEFATNSHLCVGREVALCEYKVENPMDGRQSGGILLASKLLGAKRKFPQTAAGSTEAFVDVGFAGKQSQRNFPNTEAAEGLESEHQLGFHGYRLVTADKQHPQKIVPDLTRQKDLWNVLQDADVFSCVLLQDATVAGTPAQLSHQVVLRHSKDPGRRIVRQARNRP